MRFYLIDDSPSVTSILAIIIRDRGLGEVCGIAESALDALEDLPRLRPDIVIVDLLMPEMDGITFVQRSRELLPETACIMLSQVTAQEMIARAYSAGIEFFLHKPVNSIEVEKVVRQVCELLTMRRTLSQVCTLVGAMPSAPAPSPGGGREAECPVGQRAEEILRRIGILGEAGSRDIVALVCHLAEHPEDSRLSVGALCALAGDSPKTVEQRIRRAACAGLVNLASLGVEDYGNEVFAEYAGTLYRFDQVRREMNCIKGKSASHGKVQIKQFISALVSYSIREY